MSEGPPWLGALQARFGGVIRTALDRATGSLRAQTEGYDRDAVRDVRDGPHGPAAARLAVYNRQYWYRLFTVLQRAYPLTTDLLDPWNFNEHAARYLLSQPPRGWDLDEVPDGFARFLAGDLGDRPDGAMIAEAAGIDAAWRGLTRAPEAEPFRPTPDDAARLLDARLRPSPAVALVCERWPLLELRFAREQGGRTEPVAPPEALPAPRWWALRRESRGVRHVPLEPREGELHALLREVTVREALAMLEARCDADERASLPSRAQRWLARGVELGFWAGLA